MRVDVCRAEEVVSLHRGCIFWPCAVAKPPSIQDLDLTESEQIMRAWGSDRKCCAQLA